MKKLVLIVLFIEAFLFSNIVDAASIYAAGRCDTYYDADTWSLCQQHSPYCCPRTVMYNRTRTKIIAEYQPYKPPFSPYLNMGVWRIANNPYPWGALDNNDYQDIEDAKVKTGGYWRWGVCDPWRLQTYTANYLCTE